MQQILRNDQLVYLMFVSALFFGIYFATFLQTLRCLLFTRRGWELKPSKTIQWPILAVTLAIFALSAVNHGVELKARGLQALGIVKGDWKAIVVCTTANWTAQLTDAVLVFRLWKVYNNSYRVIILPIILWICGMVLTALEIYLQVIQFTFFRVWIPVNVDIGPGVILTPFWASTILLNLYASSMIIYRLRKFKQESAMGRSTQAIDFAASLIIESGSLYLVPAIAHFVVWFTPEDFAINVISDINVPMLGIAFNFIIIRLSQRRELEQETEMRMTAIQFHHANTAKTEDIEETRSSDMTV